MSAFSTPFDETIALFTDSNSISFEEFISKKEDKPNKFRTIFQFFDNINLPEDRLRMERLKILQLLLIGLLNEYGYDFHKTSGNEIEELKNNIGGFKLLKNYIKLQKRYKLNQLYWFFPQMEIYAAM